MTLNLCDNNDYRYTTSIDVDDLIVDLFKRIESEYNKYIDDEYSDVKTTLKKETLKNYFYNNAYSFELSRTIENSLTNDELLSEDFKKVEFDFENIFLNKHTFKECGLTILSSGIPIILCKAGGDWEIPVYFALYFDGTNLRAYIPAKGNLYNPNNMLALGNDNEEDEQFLQEQGLQINDFDNLEYDIELIIQDITNHIKLKNN